MAEGFKHPKVKVHVGDGFKFLDTYKNEFDVIITDSSDPEGPAESLFQKSYFQLLYDALRPGGVITTQGCTSPLYQAKVRECDNWNIGTELAWLFLNNSNFLGKGSTVGCWTVSSRSPLLASLYLRVPLIIYLGFSSELISSFLPYISYPLFPFGQNFLLPIPIPIPIPWCLW